MRIFSVAHVAKADALKKFFADSRRFLRLVVRPAERSWRNGQELTQWEIDYYSDQAKCPDCQYKPLETVHSYSNSEIFKDCTTPWCGASFRFSADLSTGHRMNESRIHKKTTSD